MKYTVSLYGKGNEFTIGSVKEEIWDYIQDNFDGDVNDYFDAIDEGKVPYEMKICADRFTTYECDDQYRGEGPWSNYYRLTITDENGDEVFDKANEEIEETDVEIKNIYKSVEDVRYIFTSSIIQKGEFRTGEFECDEFDPSKLAITYEQVDYDNYELCNSIVGTIEYDGEEIEMDFGSTEGKGDDFDLIDVDREED